MLDLGFIVLFAVYPNHLPAGREEQTAIGFFRNDTNSDVLIIHFSCCHFIGNLLCCDEGVRGKEVRMGSEATPIFFISFILSNSNTKLLICIVENECLSKMICLCILAINHGRCKVYRSETRIKG